MKKLLAILLSALMLCTVIPFATVSAADEPTIVVSTVDAADAGDEIEVTVQLLNNPGVIAATVEIEYDSSVMELVTYYDEDEEMDMNQIEVASGWSSKYITFGPLGKCIVSFIRGTATSNVTKEDFFTATFKIKDDAVSGTYPLTVKYDPKNFFNVDMMDVYFGSEDASIVINGSDPLPPACDHEYDNACDVDCNKCGEAREVEHNNVHVEAVAPTCTENGNIEYWYCDVCGMAWLDEACTLNTNLRAVILPATGHSYFDDCSAICDVCGYEREVSHNVIHVEAVAPNCTENGNIEYWYCDVCGAAWLDEACTLNTNLRSVILPASCSYNAIHNEGIAAGCHYTGRLENWYCANCDVYYLDAACATITNYKSLTIPALQDSAEYVPAKDATCYENGNVEYWVCYECEQVWADAALTQLTNIKNVTIGMAHAEATHVAAVAATCTENGNIEYWYCADCGQAWLDEACSLNTNLKAVVLPATGHTYTNAHDVDCNACGETRDLVLPPDEIILFGGNSISELRNGLAFKFDAAVNGIVWNEEYVADYSNATVTIDGVEYKLVGMGAIVNNKGESNLTLNDVDGIRVLNVEALKVFEDANGATSFAVRIVNIPDANLDTIITAAPYYVYEANGETITVYGADIANSYNNAAN